METMVPALLLHPKVFAILHKLLFHIRCNLPILRARGQSPAPRWLVANNIGGWKALHALRDTETLVEWPIYVL